MVVTLRKKINRVQMQDTCGGESLWKFSVFVLILSGKCEVELSTVHEDEDGEVGG